MVKEKIIKKSEVNEDVKGGFFKFAEELKNFKMSNSTVPDPTILQKDVLIEAASDLPTDKINNSNEENLAGNYSNYFNDTDFDSIILQCNVEPIAVKRNNSSAASSSFSRFTSLPANNISVQVDKTQNFQRTVTMPSVLDKSTNGSCDSQLNFSGESSFGKLFSFLENF